MKTKILQILKNENDYISGEKISQKLSVSRSAIWKHIKSLKSEGYVITSVTNKGYRLESSDVINEDEIRYTLDTHFIGKNLLCFDEIDSTNNECKARSEMPDGTVIAAEVQTGGKGRLSKNWASPKGVGAWFSILLKPSIRPENVSKITLIAGLAVCRAIGEGAMIKYPNDIVIGSKKLCGILTELSAEIDSVNFVVCGIGININTPKFEGELSDKATSLLIETGKFHFRSQIIGRVLTEFEKLYVEFLENGLDNIIDDYKQNCITLGREVVVTYQGTSLTGICTDITTEGSIIVRTSDGVVTINSGDVSVRGIYGYI